MKRKSKQRFGEFEFEYFGGSDVENKLLPFNWNGEDAGFVLWTIAKEYKYYKY